MKKFAISSILALSCCAVGQESQRSAVNLLTGEGVSLGNILFPAVNFQSSYGTSTAEPAELLSGHHDPDRDGFNIQSLELSLLARFGERVSLFGTYAMRPDLDDRWDGVFEEYFASFSGLPFGATVRGGRFLTKFGMHNQNHPHGFTMADQNIANGRLLGEDGLAVEGGEISLPILRSLPTGWDDRLTLSFGRVVSAHKEGHAHGGDSEEEPEYEPEGGLFSDWTATAHYGLTLAATSQTLHTAGISAAWGDNRYGRRSQLFGANYEFLWRADGALNRTGHHETSEFIQWRTELFLRRAGAVASIHDHEEEAHHDDEELHDEEGHQDEEEHHDEAGGKPARKDFTDFAAYSVLTYGFSGGKWQAHLRGEYASGNADAQLAERWRVSPAVTWIPSESLPINWKLQYNFDHSPSFGEEHSVWLQFNLAWGSGCDHAH